MAAHSCNVACHPPYHTILAYPTYETIVSLIRTVGIPGALGNAVAMEVWCGSGVYRVLRVDYPREAPPWVGTPDQVGAVFDGQGTHSGMLRAPLLYITEKEG